MRILKIGVFRKVYRFELKADYTNTHEHPIPHTPSPQILIYVYKAKQKNMKEKQQDLWSSHARFADGTDLYLDLKPNGALKVSIVKGGQRFLI